MIHTITTVIKEALSEGWLSTAQVDLHNLDDRERLQLQEWAKASLIQYIITRNQALQLDPIVTFLRILARLRKKGDPEFAAIVNTINEIKAQAKTRCLTAMVLYMFIKPYIRLDQASEFMDLVENFIQNLIVNNLFNKKIGPPSTLICDTKLHEENFMWPDHRTLVMSINEFMKEDMEHPKKARVKWVSDNHWAQISISQKLDLQSTNVWSEFLGFHHIMTVQIHADMRSPYNLTFDWKKIQTWAEKELQQRLQYATELVNYHDFLYPTKMEWLNLHTPILNQSVILG